MRRSSSTGRRRVYDRATHALIRDMTAGPAARSQSPGLQKNADGSVDIYFGPKAPAGKEVNWVPTSAGGQFEVLFRFYGPEKPLFDKTWKLPDIEKQIRSARSVSSKACDAWLHRHSRRATAARPGHRRQLHPCRDRHCLWPASSSEGGFGKFDHNRELTPLDKQTVIRMNRDTLYSAAVFDLDAGPVTITLPDAGKRFMSMQVIDEDHYTPRSSTERDATPSRGRRSARATSLAAVRTLVDPADPKDLEAGPRLQDAIKVEQPGGPASSRCRTGTRASQKKVRDALLALGSTLPDSSAAFGARGRGRSGATPDRHRDRPGAAIPRRTPSISTSPRPRTTARRSTGSTVKDVPVDGFWSISVYNAEGYFEKNPYNAYTLNNITAKKSADGSVTVQFGGCDGKTPNCLPIMPGWNYMVRLYRPRKEILDGTWKFPEAQPVN